MRIDDFLKRSLRWRLWIGLLGLLGLAAALMLPLPAAFDREPLYGALQNMAHGPLFAGAVYLTLYLLGRPTRLTYAVVLALGCGLAVFTEFAQQFFARDAEWTDVQSDIAGVVIGAALFALRFDHNVKSIVGRAALIGAAVLAAIFVLSPGARPLGIWLDRTQRFPALIDANFEGWSTMIASMDEKDVQIAGHDGALRVTLPAGDPTGVVFTKFARDWQGFAALVIELENPGAIPLPLELYARDWSSRPVGQDWFFAQRTLQAGERATLRYELSDVEAGPTDRLMRIDEMRMLAIYRIAPGGNELLVHRIALE